MKLKTLKDLNKKIHKNWHSKNKRGAYQDEKCTEDNCPITDCLVELKEEAVKWVKKCPYLNVYNYMANEYPLRCSVCLMMIDFFNITEEDLK